MSADTVRSLVPTYTGRIKVQSGKALGLAILLAKAAPPDLSPSQRKRLSALQVAGEQVESARGTRLRMAGATIQPMRNQFAAGWGALDLALESVSLLPAGSFDDAERATAMRTRLFPEGREFPKLSSLEAWTRAQSILQLVDEEELEDELTELVGPRFLNAAKLVTNELGEVLGLGETPRKIPSATAVADAMDEYGTALSAYTRSLAADVDEKDEASCKRFFEAVAPIDLHRSSYASDDDEELVAPEPVVEPAR
jgi:hypothetical protein